MWTDSGTILLGIVLMLLGTDSLAHSVSGLIARKPDQPWLAAMGSAGVAALAPLAALVAAALLLDHVDLALGAAFGGAIAQLGLSLGVAALSAPLLARLKALVWINPALIGAVVLVWGLGFDHDYSRFDGGIMLLAFIVLGGLVVRGIWRDRITSQALFEPAARTFSTSLLLLRLLVGVALIGLGAWRLLAGTTGLAGSLALNPLIAGLLVLGPASALAGTPTAVMAARRGRGDFAFGQAFFAAIAAILLMLGGLVIVHPLTIPASIGRFELPVLFTLAVAVYPMMRSDGELSRREGGLLLLAWFAFFATELWLTFA